MEKKRFALIPYVIALAATFYLLPLIVHGSGSAMLMMLFVMPLLTFICAVIYGIRQGFDVLLPIIAAILFAPTIFIFYNTSAWIYVIMYAAVALAGNGIGRAFYRKR